MSAVSKISLTPTGTPCRGPVGLPWRRHSSAARACASAWSGSRNDHAWTCPSTSRIRARQASTNCSELITPSRIKCAASDADNKCRFVRSKLYALRLTVVREPQFDGLDEWRGEKRAAQGPREEGTGSVRRQYVEDARRLRTQGCDAYRHATNCRRETPAA